MHRVSRVPHVVSPFRLFSTRSPLLNPYWYPPRSMVTDSVYCRKRSYTVSYTTVYMPYTLRIRPYFAVLHVTVLRSYLTVTIYGEIRRNTEIVYGAFTLVNDRIFPVYGRLRPCFGKLRTLTVVFLPSHTTLSITIAFIPKNKLIQNKK